MAPIKEALENVKIRAMEPGDISAVLEFDRRISAAQRAVTYDELDTLDRGGDLEFSFVAEIDGWIIGFILARIANPGEPIAGEGLIQAIGIDPAYQRRGIATKLANAFLNKCRSRGIGKAHVIIKENDRQLQALFVSMGFGRGQLIDYALTL